VCVCKRLQCPRLQTYVVSSIDTLLICEHLRWTLEFDPCEQDNMSCCTDKRRTAWGHSARSIRRMAPANLQGLPSPTDQPQLLWQRSICIWWCEREDAMAVNGRPAEPLAKERCAVLLLFEAKMPWPQSEFHRSTHSSLFPINGEARQTWCTVHVPTDLSVASSAINFFILAFALSASQGWQCVAGSWGEFSSLLPFFYSKEKMTSSLKGQKHTRTHWWCIEMVYFQDRDRWQILLENSSN